MSEKLFPRTRSFIYGATLPVAALRLITSRPALIFWSVLPIGLTLGIYYYLIRWIDGLAHELLQNFFSWVQWNPNGLAAVAVWIFAKLLMIMVAALTFSVSASILASPFNDLLAEAAEPWTTPALAPVPAGSWRVKLRLLGIDVLKSLAAGLGTLMALALAWLPVVNFLALLASAVLLSFQFLSYPQTRRGIGVREGFAFLRRHLFACAGLGVTLSLLFAVPILSSLSLPVAVVAGTLLFAKAGAGSLK